MSLNNHTQKKRFLWFFEYQKIGGDLPRLGFFSMEPIGSPPSGIGIVPPRDPVARVPPGTWTRDREDAIWPKFGGGKGENPTPSQRLGDSLKKLANNLVGKYQPTTVQWSRIFEGKL